MSKQTPIEQFTSLLSASSFLFVVYYRGHWCPFCLSYLRTLHSLSPAISSAGGKTVLITSEPASFLPATRKSTGYSGDAIADPENNLVSYVREKYGLEIAVSEKKGYENGMAQPGILVVRGREGQGEVLEKWAIVPSMMNMGGAKDRPDLGQVWDNVKAKLEGTGVQHVVYRRIGVLGLLWGKIFG